MKEQSISFESDELLALASLDIERGNVEEALLKLKRVLADKTPPIEASAMAARLYAQLGLFERAKELFKTYLDKEPNAIVENFQFGMAHFDAGESNEALSIWDDVVKNDPVNPPALFYRGLVLTQLNKHADAKQSLDTLLKSTPADNLYFSRAKDLLTAIDAGQTLPNNQAAEISATMMKDAYQVEH